MDILLLAILFQLWGSVVRTPRLSRIFTPPSGGGWKYNLVFVGVLLIILIIAMGYFTAVWGMYTFLGVFMLFAAFVLVLSEHGRPYVMGVFLVVLFIGVIFIIVGAYEDVGTTTIVDLSFIHNIFH